MRSSQTKINTAPAINPIAARIGGRRNPCSALYFNSRIIASTNAMAPMPVKSFTPTSPSQSKLNHDVRGGGGFLNRGGGGGGGEGGSTGTSGRGVDSAAAIGSSIGVSMSGTGRSGRAGSGSVATYGAGAGTGMISAG